MTPQELGEAVRGMHSLVKILVLLVIVNLAGTAYIARFVYDIIQAVHQL
jgi:hypothetical protein